MPAATAAGIGVTGTLQPATAEAPSIGVPTTRLDVWPTATALALGQNVIFDASYDSGNFDPGIIVWTSSDESVLTVDQEGNVSAVGVGEATITVIDKDNSSLTSTSTVQVREVPEDVGMELSVPEVSRHLQPSGLPARAPRPLPPGKRSHLEHGPLHSWAVL